MADDNSSALLKINYILSLFITKSIKKVYNRKAPNTSRIPLPISQFFHYISLVIIHPYLTHIISDYIFQVP